MFDDYNDDEAQPIEALIQKFNQIKAGTSSFVLEEEDYERIVTYFFQRSNDADALLACEIGHTYFPFSSQLLLLKAEILTQTQKYGQALKVLDELYNIDQANLSAVLLRVDIYLNQDKQKQCITFIESTLDVFEPAEKIELLLELADVYDELEDFEQVYQTLKRVLVIEPTNEEALQKVSFWADFTQAFEDSAAIHEQITIEAPYCVLAWFNLGAAYQGLKAYEKAVDAYQYCIAIDEHFEFAYRNLADAYMRLKKYQEALEVLETHLELSKPEDVIFEAMAYCWEKQRNYTLARHYYRQAAKLNPEDDMIFFKIGETYAREKEWAKAAKSFNAAINLDKDNHQYYMAMGACLMEMGEQVDGLLCFLNAVKLKPNIKATWILLVTGLIEAEQYDDAIIQLELAEVYCGAKAEFKYLHAATLFGLGKSKEALQIFDDALATNIRKLKTFTDIYPDYSKRSAINDLIAKYKKPKK